MSSITAEVVPLPKFAPITKWMFQYDEPKKEKKSQSFVYGCLCLALRIKLNVESSCIIGLLRGGSERQWEVKSSKRQICEPVSVIHFVWKNKWSKMILQILKSGQCLGHLIKDLERK